jgi:glucosamine--fructose-6-phosphate aminotransferase (isomerizing)
LERTGRTFETETDSEVVAHLLTCYLDQGLEPEAAMAEMMERLQGAFSLAILIAGRPDIMLGARRGSPLAVGYGTGEMYLASDATPMARYAQRICYLQEDDWVVLSRDTVSIYNGGRPVNREVKGLVSCSALIGKGEYRHFMMKEIAEQPDVIADTLHAFFDPMRGRIQPPALPFDLAMISHLTIVACGTAYFAGFVAKYWLERIARLPVELEIASEFRYREALMRNSGATLVISQSGETADTLAALRYAKSQGQTVTAVLNVPESTIGRESDAVLHTLAGPEIGVASTKAFTTQLVVLAALAIAAARARGAIDVKREAELSVALAELPARAAEVLARDAPLKALAPKVAECRDVLFLGRGSSYPIALEGALKLKEISYIHAEGYAAGEMKHGPIALIDDKVAVVVLAPSDHLFEKTASNVEEVRARGGRVILLSDKVGIERLHSAATTAIELPSIDPFVAPILYAIPLQLLAYYVATTKGTDVDQPRNLAKSVTVE